uniref:Uncharacterized protein n=1 Tax=Aquila chrysaetos chrysaetos TaxID=223781 RepID=A0A663FGH4_AQUCH
FITARRSVPTEYQQITSCDQEDQRPSPAGRGMFCGLGELGITLSRLFWGVKHHLTLIKVSNVVWIFPPQIY